MTSITENSATITFKDKNEVFYNPVQETNRDLSILVIKRFIAERDEEHRQRVESIIQKRMARAQESSSSSSPVDDKLPTLSKVRLLEALSATGLRSIRFCKEIVSDSGEPLLGHVLVNDIEPAAVATIKRNLEANGVSGDLAHPNLGDATQVMYDHRAKDLNFDVIDLDPYGSAAIFLDSAVQSVSEGGLLCITCTDLKVLCGQHPEVCFSKYNSFPLKGKMSHEMAIRILLYSLECHANRYKRHIVPMISMQIDFYLRVFVRVYSSALKIKESSGKLSHVYQCVSCGSLHFQPLAKVTKVGSSDVKVVPGPAVIGPICSECGSHFRVAGPIWTDPIVDESFLSKALSDLNANENKYGHHKRLRGMLTALSEEIHTAPLFHTLGEMANVLHCNVPARSVLLSSLAKHGYTASASHCEPDAIKTTAPVPLLWDFFRAWEKANPVVRKAPNAPGTIILSRPLTHEIDLSVSSEILESRKKRKDVARYLPNPRDGWGPGSRAHCGRKRPKFDTDEGEEKESEDIGGQKEGKMEE